MFFFENPCGKRFGIVRIQHGHGRLHDDRPAIQHIIHDVHRAPAELHAVVQRLLLHVTARETTAAGKGECSGCRFGNAFSITGLKIRMKPASTTSPTSCRVQSLNQFRIELFARPAFRRDADSDCKPRSRARARPGRGLDIADDDRNLGIAAFPQRRLSAMASKLDPRPERRIPIRRLRRPDLHAR